MRIFAFAFLLLTLPIAAQAACDYNKIVDASPLLQQEYVDSSARILQDPSEAQKARQILNYVQRIFMHPNNQTLVMYGWQDVGQNSGASVPGKISELESAAKKQGFEFSSRRLDANAAIFKVEYNRLPWPQRETALEMQDGECWITVKFGGNEQHDAAQDSALLKLYDAELTRMYEQVSTQSAASLKERILSKKTFTGTLPSFHLSVFWELMLPTLLLAMIAGLIISRAARMEDNIHASLFSKISAGLWVLYAVIITFFSEIPLGLEHYFYAAIMITVSVLAVLLHPSLVVTAISLNLAHILRSTMFILFGIHIAPRLVWFEVGLLSLAVIYVLALGFKRQSPLSDRSSKRNVVDRTH